MIRIYSIQDLTDWLMDGKENGLSDAVISKPRAWAFANNPFAIPTTPVAAVLFQEGEMKGYAAVFPERFEGIAPTVYWGSTFFVDDSMRGKGCGVKILSALQESLDGVYATTQTPVSSSAIFKKLGAGEVWFPEYWLKLQRNNPTKGKHSVLKQGYNRLNAVLFQKRNHLLRWCESFHFQLEYVSFIDDETYLFIRQHQGKDLLMRSKEMMNWMLRYPFLQNVVLEKEVKKGSNYFSCNKSDFQQYAVKVLNETGELVGFYMFKYNEGEVNLLYMYYTPDSKEMVMASFYKHLLKMEIVRLRTSSSELVAFFKRNALPVVNTSESRLNLCAPKVLAIPEGVTIQGGDGDMFVI
jgi:GNAT superfamily N-acetyltransferase